MQLINNKSSIIIFGICIIITSTLLGWSSRSSWGLAIIEVIILSILLLAITQIDKADPKLPAILKIFLFFIILSTLFSVYHYNSILDLVMYILFITTFWIITKYINNRRRLRIIVFIISSIALIAAVNGIVNFFQLQDISLGVVSFFGWRNIFSGFILLTLPITLTQFLTEKKWREKIFYGIITVLLLGNLYFTFSQASWISMIIVFLLLIWLLRKISFKQLIVRTSIIVAITFIMVLGLLQIHSPENTESLQQANIIQSNAISNRIDYWKTSWEMFIHYPWTGVGVGNFETIYTHFQQNIWSFSVSPHNSMLLFLTELGIFGLLVFIAFLLSTLKKVKQIFSATIVEDKSIYYYSVGIFGGIIASFGHSLVDVDWEIPALLLLWFIEVGLIFAIGNSQFGKIKETLKTENNNSKFQIIAFILSLLIGYILIISTLTTLWNEEADIAQDDFGDIENSIGLLEKAIALNPLNADLYSNLSESYQIQILDHKGIREENQYNSIKYATKAVELDSLSARRHESLGYALNFISSGIDNEILLAEEELIIALSYNPYNTIYQYQLLGFILQRQGKYQKAIEIFDNALKIFSGEDINKIFSGQEMHNQLIEQIKTIKDLRETIIMQTEKE